MTTITLTIEQHEDIQRQLDEAHEALENAETVLANRTIDTDELEQDLQDIAGACSNIRKLAGGIF